MLNFDYENQGSFQHEERVTDRVWSTCGRSNILKFKTTIRGWPGVDNDTSISISSIDMPNFIFKTC